MKRQTNNEFQRKGIALFLVTILLIVCILADRNQFSFTNSQSDVKAATAQKTTTTPASDPVVPKEVRASWLSFGDYSAAGLYDKTKADFTRNADQFFKAQAADHINAVYFHVCPCNDAIYPSKLLKYSSYMFRKKPNYDALEILVTKAHKYNISLHAWINPYRQTMTGSIFNPGKASSLNRIVKIVKEILTNYDVDGIHFDDYFYPSPNKGAYLYKVSQAKRKKVVNKMLRKVYTTVKSFGKDLQFGISPAGNVEYAESLGCDISTWLSKDGYMDYIVPQIYWSDRYLENGTYVKLYTRRLNQWVKLNKNHTPMYIGLGLYRAGVASSIDSNWGRKNNNIATQIKQARAKGCEGFVLYSTTNMTAKPGAKEMAKYRSLMKKS